MFAIINWNVVEVKHLKRKHYLSKYGKHLISDKNIYKNESDAVKALQSRTKQAEREKTKAEEYVKKCDSLIEQILSLNPNIKGLGFLIADELTEILNELKQTKP